MIAKHPVTFIPSYSTTTFNFWSESPVSPRSHNFLSFGMKLVKMLHEIRVLCKRAPTVLADKHFWAPLAEAKLVYHAVHARKVRFKRAALRERLVASAALEWLYSCVCSYVALQIKRVIEAFGAELAVVTLVEWVRLHVAIQQALQCEGTVANFAFVLRFVTVSTFSVLFLVLKIWETVLLLMRR